MLMRIASFIFFLIAFGTAFGQTTEWVCIPCGHPCDDKVYTSGSECPTCRMALVPKSTVSITNLDASQFCARIAENPDVLVLDVRSEKEFNGTSSVETFGHFKKAININVNQLSKRLSEIAAYKDKEVLIYCSHSMRSPKAAYYLNNQGFKNVKNLTGGVSKLGSVVNSPCYKEQYVAHPR